MSLDIKSKSKPKLPKQLLWFGGLYLASLIILGSFHGIIHWCINLLK